MKKFFYTVCALVFAAALTCAASATSYNDVDMDYSGVLGSYFEPNARQTEEQSSRIAITSTISYSPTERKFYIVAADIAKPFTSTVMDGMITKGTVALSVPEGIAYELYRDGELSADDIARLEKPGTYVLRIKSNAGVSVTVISFTITGDASGAVTGYRMPEGFVITKVTFNGGGTSFSDSYADMTEDGDYVVEYRCAATNIAYTLELKADHTPPELKLEALKDGKAWGPVDISDLEPGGSAAVYRNGEAEPYTPQLTKSGQYDVIVSDAAGNKTSYSFTIMIYFNSGSLVFFIAVAVILAGVAVYVIIAGKKLRIR